MKRTNISLTDEQYRELKENAHRNGVSMSFVIRGLILKLHEPPEKKPQSEVTHPISTEKISFKTTVGSTENKPQKIKLKDVLYPPTEKDIIKKAVRGANEEQKRVTVTTDDTESLQSQFNPTPKPGGKKK